MHILYLRYWSQPSRTGKERWEKEGSYLDEHAATIAAVRTGHPRADRKVEQEA